MFVIPWVGNAERRGQLESGLPRGHKRTEGAILAFRAVGLVNHKVFNFLRI